MPNLLSINNYFYRRGGADVVFFEHQKMFKNIGWKTAFFAMKHPKNETSEWSQYFVDELEFGTQYSLAEKARRVPKFIYSFEARKKLDQLLQVFSADVAHIHNLYHHISPSILSLLKKRNIPVFLTLHDLKIACPAYSMLNQHGVCERCKGGNLHNILINRCIKSSLALSSIVYLEGIVHSFLDSYAKNVTRFVVPSRFYLEKFVEWGWDRDKFVYIPNFVDCEARFPCFEPGKHIVFFGRLSKEKGVHTLIKAAHIANLPIKIIGSGPEEQYLRELANTLGVDASFIGYKQGDELQDLVRSARVTVLPSEWYENAPLNIMESYSLGKPVIGAKIGGIPELIKEGITGFMFDSGSAEKLAIELRKVFEMPDAKVIEMGKSGHHWMKTEFNASLYEQRILDLYESVGI